MKFKTEASVLDRLRRWRELFGEPMPNGRNNPDNDMWFLVLDAEECIAGLQSYARSLEANLTEARRQRDLAEIKRSDTERFFGSESAR